VIHLQLTGWSALRKALAIGAIVGAGLLAGCSSDATGSPSSPTPVSAGSGGARPAGSPAATDRFGGGPGTSGDPGSTAGAETPSTDPDATPTPPAEPQPTDPTQTPTAKPEPTPKPTAPPVTQAGEAPRSDTLRLHRIQVISGGLTPKSVVASQSGLFFAQNMIYGHNIAVFDRSFQRVEVIPDRIRLSQFGYSQYPSRVHGGPVEAAFSPDAATVYVSNYSMYGPGFTHPGRDDCRPNEGIDRSFVYRIDVGTFRKTGALRVGSVPKFVAVSPDGSTLVVANWCSGSVSIVDLKTFTETARVEVGWHPRGIVFDSASKRAYVAVWDANAVAVVNLASHTMRHIPVGLNPRHLAIDPKGRYLYVSLNGAGKIAKLDLDTEQVVASVRTGREPRSMVIAPDGRSLYVVNYSSDTISKVRSSDMTVLQTISTGHHPIGITYDNSTRNVWVAVYSGALLVFHDR
jgi:YVTN family beta-propeller protein